MPIDFPNSPTLGDDYTVGTTTWTYDGSKWVLKTYNSLHAVPVGAMLTWSTSTYPTGWMRADGTAISRTQYADLFNAIGTTYGVGDGSTTFNLPNLISSGSASPVSIIKVTSSGAVEPSSISHAVEHVRGGADVVDGDRVQLDWVPTAYTRNSSPSEAGATTDLTAHLSGIDNAFKPAFVTSLPGSPYDGQIIYYQANATDGVIWQLRYNSSSASAYKWEFIGGGKLVATAGSRAWATKETYNSLTYGDLATVGPSITAPLSGDYLCTFKANCVTSTTSGNIRVFVTGDSTFTWDTDTDSQGFSGNHTLNGIVKRSAVSSGNTIKLQYAVSNAGTNAEFWNRQLSIEPIRVG